MLYPLKFQPILKPRIWGGTKLQSQFGKTTPTNEPIGESWELSAVAGDVSVVANGALAGETLTNLLKMHREDLVGKKVFSKYKFEFPLLFKFLDANEKLSIQVHPNDEVAFEKHGCSGKTEMWYIIDTEPEAKIYLGFNEKMTVENCINCIKNATLEEKLQEYSVKAGDVFSIPAGTVHALGKGILLAEIQQSSDITYRLYDYNRRDKNGNLRELHLEQALQVVDFDANFSSRIIPAGEELLRNDYFNVNKISFESEITRDYSALDSFVVLMCTKGKGEIGGLDIAMGETVLVPAVMKNVSLQADCQTEILEIWV